MIQLVHTRLEQIKKEQKVSASKNSHVNFIVLLYLPGWLEVKVVQLILRLIDFWLRVHARLDCSNQRPFHFLIG